MAMTRIRKSLHTASLIEQYASKHDKILDVGCGSGRVSQILEKKGYDIHSADIVDYRQVPVKKFSLYDGRLLPFSDDSFDMVCFNFVLHHVPNEIKQQLLLEAKRVTRKHVFILEDTPKNVVDQVMSFIHCFFWRWRILSDAAFGFYSQMRWESIFRATGLRVIVSIPLSRSCRGIMEPLSRSVFVLSI